MSLVSFVSGPERRDDAFSTEPKETDLLAYAGK